MSIKVSIILPVYNVEKYLRESIESAINQTLMDIEIIAVNDGSTDSSLDILKKYEKKYSSVKVIDQENKGLSGARNTGLNIAKGEYVYFLDSDDYIDLDAMRYCYNIAKENNLDIVTFDATSFRDRDYNGKLLSGNYDRKSRLDSKVRTGEEFYNYAKENRGYRPPVWLNFYKREFLKSNNIDFYEGIIHEDELFSIKSFLLAKKVMYIPKVYFNRRVRQDSIMTKKISDKNYHGFFVTANESYKFYILNKDKFKSNTNSKIIKHISSFYSKAIMYCDQLDIDNKKKESIRNSIINNLKEKKELVNNSLIIQLKFPKLYYYTEYIKSILKNKIR